MSKRYSKDQLSNIKGKRIFFDANILIYLFWSTGAQYFEREYSSIFSSLLKMDTALYVDFIIVSEFVNRAIKLEYNNQLWKTNQESKDYSYKRYRDSEDGKEMLADIYKIIEGSILDKFQVTGKEFNKMEIREFLQVDCLDFSDKAIELICKENDYVLLTNDNDFRNSDIDILSMNNSLLNSSENI